MLKKEDVDKMKAAKEAHDKLIAERKEAVEKHEKETAKPTNIEVNPSDSNR